MIVRGGALVPVAWRNGLGVTRDVVTRGVGVAGFAWQVSIAELERDCSFSHFPGCERVFTPLAGEVALAFGAGGFEECPVLVPRRFSGEVATRCRVGRAGRAFNLVYDRGQVAVDVEVLRLGAGEAVQECTVMHCLEGVVEVSEGVLGTGDSWVERRGGGRAVRAAAVMRVMVRDLAS